MHHVLYMQEILLEIFSYCCNNRAIDGSLRIGMKNLSALARTCKVFKEPALDILWAGLRDLTPLVRCLPEASRINEDHLYSLERPLREADWNIILGFTHRVRACWLEGSSGLAADCFEALSNPPASDTSIFPNLCEIRISSPVPYILPFMRHFSGPRLTVLSLQDTQDLGGGIEAFGERCPNISSFDCMSHDWEGEQKDDVVSHLICQWPKLRFVECNNIALNALALIHLTHTPSLRLLSFELHDVVIDRIRSTLPSASIMTLPALVRFELRSLRFATVWKFFDDLRLPAIQELYIYIETRSTALELKSFLATIHGICNHHFLTAISFYSFRPWFMADPLPGSINFDYLFPLTVFVNVRVINLNVACATDLNEKELLLLASSWPHLEVFVVGWSEYKNTISSAITPEGFVQLLDRCRSLSQFSFPFDTRGYTEVPQGHPWHGFTMPKNAVIDVCLSSIEEESVEAVGVFFQVAPFPNFLLIDHWRDYDYLDEADGLDTELFNLYSVRWEKVRSIARDLWEERDSLLCLLKERAQTTAGQSEGYDLEDNGY